jgi:membrane protein required for colicin V production
MDFSQWAALDWGLLALLAASVLVGLWRGLVYELLSLAGWLVAWLVAQWYGPALAAWLPLGQPGSASRSAAGFVVAFIAALVIWSLLAKLARLLISATPLQLIDRLLGAAFGLVRGGVILLVLATVISYTPFSNSTWWRASRSAAWLDQAVQVLRPLWPASQRPADQTLVNPLSFTFQDGYHPCAASLV